MTEKYLLFAVLAFESDLIDLAQLIAACRAWAADKSKPLADLLVERGWITAEDRGFVEKQLERKLAKHQNDPRVTLNAITRGDVCDAIKEIDDSDIQQSLSSWPSSGPVLVESIDKTMTLDPSLLPKSRYTWVSEVGKGGLGKIWLARDNDLAREVALKELKPGSASSEAVRRLIKEAQITGQLQHPNIVPVYEVNRGGRPFYTMKLVKGETLLKAIQRHHVQRRAAGPEDRRQQSDALSEQRLMSVFLNVCDAIAYAHSRGIIHRDLKPENIVLGEYGEAIVLDWGLARRVNATDEETAPVEITADACTNATQAGQKLGTPAYMSPEQASGRVDLMDPRTDIYGLGAILFQILTGEPPHRQSLECGDESPRSNEKPRVVSSLIALLHRIATGETPHVRDLDDSHPEELDAICAKAMSKTRDERFQTAQALKAALLEFQVHKKSIELAAAAADKFDEAQRTGHYQDYNRALFAFEEALHQWNDNTRAAVGIIETRIAYTQSAFERGDYDLALSVLNDTLPDHAERRAAIQHAAAERAAQKQLNEQLHRRDKERTVELEKALLNLQIARDQAIEASHSKSAILKLMDVDFREDLNSIIGYGELLMEDAQDAPIAPTTLPDLKKIVDSGRHLSMLINDVLDLSKVEDNKMEVSLEEFGTAPTPRIESFSPQQRVQTR